MAIVREGLRSQIRGAVQKAIHDKQEIMIKARVKRDGNYHPVRLTVIPVKAPKPAEGLVVITFTEAVESANVQAGTGVEMEVTSEALVSQLESELSETKEDLRNSVEEMEAANEELKTSNEEVLSMNEELQSTNEELETSKEELQSLNEELTTVNNQLQDKVEDLASANDDLANLLSNTNIAALFLDLQFRIKRFTPATCKLFNLIVTDVGRPVSDISHRINDLNLLDDAEVVLANLTPVEKEVHTDNKECFIQRIQPFRTEDNRIEGVVVTFVDVSRLKQAERSLARSKDRIELLLQSTGEAIFGVDEKGQCIFINNKFSEHLGFSATEVLGNNESENPCLVAESTTDAKPCNHADEDYLLPHSIVPIITGHSAKSPLILRYSNRYAGLGEPNNGICSNAISGSAGNYARLLSAKRHWQKMALFRYYE
jgi:two-component system CheB/CheR fusion protein